jgi:hypothetical protein
MLDGIIKIIEKYFLYRFLIDGVYSNSDWYHFFLTEISSAGC